MTPDTQARICNELIRHAPIDVDAFGGILMDHELADASNHAATLAIIGGLREELARRGYRAVLKANPVEGSTVELVPSVRYIKDTIPAPTAPPDPLQDGIEAMAALFILQAKGDPLHRGPIGLLRLVQAELQRRVL